MSVWSNFTQCLKREDTLRETSWLKLAPSQARKPTTTPNFLLDMVRVVRNSSAKKTNKNKGGEFGLIVE